MSSWERIVSQFTSGRWLLTVTSGLCLLAMALTDCYVAYMAVTKPGATPVNMPFSVEALLAIITAVFMAYFGKTPASAGSNGNGNGDADADLLTGKPPQAHQP